MKRSIGGAVARGGMLSMARLLAGVVRVKVLALALGVGGVGVYAILLQLYLTGVAAVSMSLAVPIINLGRPKVALGQFDEAGSVAGTALAMVGANVLILLLLAAGFGQQLLNQLGVGGEASGLVWPITAAIVIGAVSCAFWEGMSYLSDRFDIYVRAGIVGAVADMLLVAGGAALFGLHGAMLGMAAGTAIMFAEYALLIAREPTTRQILRNLSARLTLLPQLFAYSAMMFATAAAANMTITFLRSRVLVEAGANANGILQTVTSLSAYLLAFVMTGFWGHLHPLAAAHGDTAEVRSELAQSLRLGLLISFTGCGLAAVTAPIIIPLFFAKAFAPGATLLIGYLPGELCFQLFSMLAGYQLTVSRRRIYVALNFGYILLLAIVGKFLIPTLGASGYVAAHVIASVIMATFAMLIAARMGQMNASLVATSAGLVATLTAVSAMLLHGHQAGYSFIWLTPALLPFVASGILVLAQVAGKPVTLSDLAGGKRSVTNGAGGLT